MPRTNIGYSSPFLFPLFTQGIISQRQKLYPADKFASIHYVLETSSGSSGGPVFNSVGKVVGVNYAGFKIQGQGSRTLDDLGFAIPALYLEKILQDLKTNTLTWKNASWSVQTP